MEAEMGTALVLGATGGIGGEVARGLREAGWRVRAMARSPRGGDGLDWVRGDAMRPEDVMAAAEGARLIVHAVNPPGYRDWDRLVLPMLDSTLAAAARTGARVVLPGTVYNYAPDIASPVAEDAPQEPATRKGRIRVAMERRLEEAAAAGRSAALIVRAGDFFGPRPGNNWFSQGMVRPGRPVRAVTVPWSPGVGHQWAYLPDAAAAIVRLAGRELPPFARFHLDGVWDPDGTRLVAAIREAVGHEVAVRRFPWLLARLAAPAVPLFRELLEMRPLWRRPLRLGNAAVVAELGEEPRTPLPEAMRATLAGLGCLPAPA